MAKQQQLPAVETRTVEVAQEVADAAAQITTQYFR